MIGGIGLLISVILLIVLVVVNGIFSASELAFLSLDKYKLKEDVKNNNKKAIKVKKLLDNPDIFLSTIQIAITLAGFLASAFAADIFVDYFISKITISFIPIGTMRSILLIVITIFLSYFTLVFGELVPKRIAINYPVEISYTFASLITVVKYLCYPLIKVLTFSSGVVCRLLRIKSKGNKITEDDIKLAILNGWDEGIIEEKEKEYILNIFSFNDTIVEKIMVERDNVVMLDIEAPLKENLLIIKRSKYTRFPVFEGNKNNIIGILNVKDMILQYKNNNIELRSILRPVISFSRNEKIDDVFRYMQENRENFSLICENDKFLGIVTIEDAIEEILGNIYDEYN